MVLPLTQRATQKSIEVHTTKKRKRKRRRRILQVFFCFFFLGRDCPRFENDENIDNKILLCVPRWIICSTQRFALTLVTACTRCEFIVRQRGDSPTAAGSAGLGYVFCFISSSCASRSGKGLDWRQVGTASVFAP